MSDMSPRIEPDYRVRARIHPGRWDRQARAAGIQATATMSDNVIDRRMW